LCRELVDIGLDLTLLCLESDRDAESPDWIRAFAYGIGPWRLGSSPDMVKWLERNAASGNVKIVHTHGMWMMPNIYAGWVAKKWKLPLIVAPRGTLTEYSMASGSWVKKIFWPLIQRPVLESVTCFHATCESEVTDIRRLGFRQPVAVIPNGIDEIPTGPPSVDPMRTILYLGRIHPEKGVDNLIRAWALVEKEAVGWRLRIAGYGDAQYIDQVKRLCSLLGVERCEVLGPVYGERKIKAYQDCDIYALFSMGDNFAVTVAEAMMVGRPVICTKGAPWAGLESRRAGWWVEGNVESFAAAIRSATQLSRRQLMEFGGNGRRWMLDEFSWRHIGDGMCDLYRWILNGGDRPPFVICD
jgi:glycosyltransferase involved in cell wall biosynthesis